MQKYTQSLLRVSAHKRAILRRYSAKIYTKEGDIKMNERGIFLTSIDDVPCAGYSVVQCLFESLTISWL